MRLKGPLERQTIGAVVLLSALVAAVFLQTAGHEFITLDDDSYVYGNEYVLKGLTTASVGWALTTFYQMWQPVTWLSHLLDVSLFGLNPAGHHLHNVLLHLGSTLFLFLFLRKLTGEAGKSLLVAALFAVHPLRAESVAWVAQRKDVLGAFFVTASLYAYSVYCRDGSRRAYLLAVGAFALSLMSKPTMVMMPFVLLLVDWWPLGRLSGRGDIIGLAREKIPFLLLSAAVGVLTVIAQYRNSSFSTLEQMPLAVRTGNSIISFWSYLGKLFFPFKLSFYYPFDFNRTLMPVLAGLMALVLACVLIVLLRRRIPELAFGWLWFLITIVPVLGIIPMADRYTYLTTIGLIVAAVWGAERAFAGFSVSRTAMAGVSVAAVAMYGAVCWGQVSLWRDSRTLYVDALKLNAGNYMAMTKLGDLHMFAGEFREAIPLYNRSLMLAPAQPYVVSNLGVCHDQAGNPLLAVTLFLEAVRLAPEIGNTYYNLGMVLQELGDYAGSEQAFVQWRKLGTADPNFRFIGFQSPTPVRLPP